MKVHMNNVVLYILKELPEYRNSEELNEVKIQLDNPYIIFGNLAIFYLRNLEEKNYTVISKMSNLFEELSLNPDIKIQTLVAYGFLEYFDHHGGYYSKLKSTFGKETLRLLEEVEKFWDKN